MLLHANRGYVFYRNFNSDLFNKYGQDFGHYFYCSSQLNPLSTVEAGFTEVKGSKREAFFKSVVSDFQRTHGITIKPIRLQDLAKVSADYNIAGFDLYLPWGQVANLWDGHTAVSVHKLRPVIESLSFRKFNSYYQALKGMGLSGSSFTAITGYEKQLDRKFNQFLKTKAGCYEVNRQLITPGGQSQMSAYLALGICPIPYILSKASGEFHRQVSWAVYCKAVILQKWRTYPPLSPEQKKALHDWQFSKLPGTSQIPLWVNKQMSRLHAGEHLTNRTRLIIAGYVLRDLQIPWAYAAAVFKELLVDSHPEINDYNWFAQSRNRFLKSYNIPHQVKKWTKEPVF